MATGGQIGFFYDRMIYDHLYSTFKKSVMQHLVGNDTLFVILKYNLQEI